MGIGKASIQLGWSGVEGGERGRAGVRIGSLSVSCNRSKSCGKGFARPGFRVATIKALIQFAQRCCQRFVTEPFPDVHGAVGKRLRQDDFGPFQKGESCLSRIRAPARRENTPGQDPRGFRRGLDAMAQTPSEQSQEHDRSEKCGESEGHRPSGQCESFFYARGVVCGQGCGDA